MCFFKRKKKVKYMSYATPNIAVLNESTVVTDSEIEALTAALQLQITNDFAPIWGRPANVHFYAKGEVVPPDAWQLVALDNADQAGALGYHDVTPTGMPLGKFFTKTCQQYNESWTVDASHELMEMLVDPMTNSVVTLFDHQGSQYLAALEVADACEDDTFGYKINNILVSDFVYPSWFGQAPNLGTEGANLDHMGKLHTSLPEAMFQGNPKAALGYGGYIGVQSPGGQWSQVLDQNRAPHKILAKAGGRFDKRIRGLFGLIKSVLR